MEVRGECTTQHYHEGPTANLLALLLRLNRTWVIAGAPLQCAGHITLNTMSL